MKAGGERSKDIALAQRIFCASTAAGWGKANAACEKRVAEEVARAEAAAGEGLVPQQLLTGFVRKWAAIPYCACVAEGSARSTGASAGGSAKVRACLRDYAEGRRKISVHCRTLPAFGPNGFLSYAATRAKAGMGAASLFARRGRLSGAIEQQIERIAGGDALIGKEVRRLCWEQLEGLSERQQRGANARDAAARDVLSAVREYQNILAPDGFKSMLVTSLVEQMPSRSDRATALLRQVPVLFAPLARRTRMPLTDLAVRGELRRLYGEAEIDLLGRPDVSAAVRARAALLTEEEQRTLVSRLRQRVADELAVAATKMLRGAAPGDIAERLRDHDAEISIPEKKGADLTFSVVLRRTGIQRPSSAVWQTMTPEEKDDYREAVCRRRAEIGVADPCRDVAAPINASNDRPSDDVRRISETKAAVCEEVPAPPTCTFTQVEMGRKGKDCL